MKNWKMLLIIGVLAACNAKHEMTVDEKKAYEDEINSWHTKRVEDLKSENGWLNLVGLHWLEPGINTFGSSDKNSIVFPAGKIAENAGYFLLEQNEVTLFARPDAKIKIKGKEAGKQEIVFHPDSSNTTLIESGSLFWNIIKRDTKIGIRLRDKDSELVKTFTDVDRFPVDPEYKIEATFEKSDSSRKIAITNVLGQTSEQQSTGTLVFYLDGVEQRLDVLDQKDEFFVIFSDATSGKETYGAGRFIDTPKPDVHGKVIIDFNKSYNPPCAFTPYATCPLPPKQNALKVAIKAGEKNYGEGHVVAMK